MSVCAIKVTDKKIYLAADCQITCGNIKEIRNIDAKIHKINDTFAFAASGNCSDSELFFLYALTHSPSSNRQIDLLSSGS